MDNQAMFTAQQMQYNKMYGMDPSRWDQKMKNKKTLNLIFQFFRRMDELAAQSSLNARYGQHP